MMMKNKWMKKNKIQKINKLMKINRNRNKKIKKNKNLTINKCQNNKKKAKVKWINNNLAIIKIEYYKDFNNILMTKLNNNNKVNQN